MERAAPIFAVRDLDVAMEHYRRLGFDVRAYAGGGYGFASWHGIEIHLGVVTEDDRRVSAAYLFVDDADRVADQWRSAGVAVHTPQDTNGANTKAPSSILMATSSAFARRWADGEDVDVISRPQTPHARRNCLTRSLAFRT
jgi:hypothetical protein